MMIVFKIVFWLFVANSLCSMFDVAADHPRERKPMNLGTDIVVWTIATGLAIWLGISIWGG